MTETELRPNSVPWPPLIYVAAILLSVLLAYLVPLPWIGSPMSDILFAVGCVTVVMAVVMEIAAMRALARHKTTIKPHQASAHLVTDGPYAFTRNPIYLGNTMLMIGAGLIFGIVWLIGLAIAAAFATQKLAIEGEERHLDLRFTKRFRDYRKKVRRWI